jgi:hypothetical protein
MNNLRKTIILLIILSLTSCQFREHSSPQYILNKLGITKETYNNLSLCQKLDTVVNIGYDFIDRGHLTLVLPEWLTEGLSPPADKEGLLSCIDNEYKEITEEIITKDKNNSKKEKVTTLLYLLIELNLQKEVTIRSIFHSSICEDGLIDDIVLLRLYYFLLNSRFPENSIRPKSLVALICTIN